MIRTKCVGQAWVSWLPYEKSMNKLLFSRHSSIFLPKTEIPRRRRRGSAVVMQFAYFLFGVQGACRKAGQVGVDKAVNVAVHNRVDVRVFKAGARVLGERVGHENV